MMGDDDRVTSAAVAFEDNLRMKRIEPLYVERRLDIIGAVDHVAMA